MIIGAGRSGSPREPRVPRAGRSDNAGPLPPKLIPAVRSLLSTAGSLLHTRLAIAGVELEEEVQRFLSAAVFGVIALVFLLLALIVGTFTIVVAVPAEYRISTMIVITVLYFAIAGIGAVRLRAIFANRPPIFAGTLAEIEKDRETLAQINRAHREAAEAREREEEARVDAERATRRAARGAR